MAYIGKIPAAAALTSSDIANDIITEAKMANDAIGLTELKAGTDGEIISWDASGNPVAIGAGTSGHFLKSQGAGSQPVFAAAGGGKIGQVLSATDETLRSTTSTSFVTASNTLSVDITPSATSSKIFITTDFSSGASTNNQVGQFTIYRDSTNLGNAEGMVKFASYVGGDNYFPIGMNYLDSPSSTSQLTYQVYLKVNTGTSYINYGAMKCSITVMEVLA